MRESGKGTSTTILFKFKDPDGWIYQVSRSGAKLAELEQEFKRYLEEKRKILGNVFLNEGINYIWTAVCGGSFTPLSSTNAYIGVGDGTAPENPAQTGLQGANKYYKGMDTGYPIYGSDQKAVFRSTFGSDEANFAWNEWTVANGSGDQYININRKVENLGTKTQGSTWILTVELRIA
ncbi:MAG: hypothetical protein QW733_02080 [Desulfurococcaceae archaeon]|uniref:hypothetical protein n=1 Tax=Desulfurococcus sp. TaxID=51678 RepID=UPI00316028AA